MEGCEKDWKFYKHLCYQVNLDPNDSLTHQEAGSICLAKGAYLTSVWDNQEKDFIMQELLSVSPRQLLAFHNVIRHVTGFNLFSSLEPLFVVRRRRRCPRRCRRCCCRKLFTFSS